VGKGSNETSSSIKECLMIIANVRRDKDHRKPRVCSLIEEIFSGGYEREREKERENKP
jgi:hypothetical protein